MYRRRYLAALGGGMAAGLAGCTGGSGNPSSNGDSDTGNTTEDGGSDTTADGSNQSESDSASTGDDEGRNESESESDAEPSLKLLSHEWYEEDYSAGVKGTAKNTTEDSLGYAEVAATFLDSDGAQLESGMDNTTELAGGREWKFDVMFLGDDPSAVEDYEISTSTSP